VDNSFTLALVNKSNSLISNNTQARHKLNNCTKNLSTHTFKLNREKDYQKIMESLCKNYAKKRKRLSKDYGKFM